MKKRNCICSLTFSIRVPSVHFCTSDMSNENLSLNPNQDRMQVTEEGLLLYEVLAHLTSPWKESCWICSSRNLDRNVNVSNALCSHIIPSISLFFYYKIWAICIDVHERERERAFSYKIELECGVVSNSQVIFLFVQGNAALSHMTALHDNQKGENKNDWQYQVLVRMWNH